MNRPFRAVVERLIALGNEYERKSRIHEAEHGTEHGIKLGSTKAEHYFEATQLLDRKLRSYLATLSEDDLRKVETFLYFGRGDSDDVFSLHAHLISTSPAREDVTRTIVEKIPPLASYLEAALKKAEASDLDIEGSFD